MRPLPIAIIPCSRLTEDYVHVLEHFAQHTGQIIFVTKAATGADLGYYKHLDRVGLRGDSTP